MRAKRGIMADDWGKLEADYKKLEPQIKRSTLAQASKLWRLEPGDLIYTGTPEGVGAVVRGDTMLGAVTGLEPISVRVA